MDNSTPEVDASRPFRSVKEAVSIFGDRLFLKQIPSFPKLPTIQVGNVTPQSLPELPTIEVGDETPQSLPELPTTEVGNVTLTPQASPKLPIIEVGNVTPRSLPEQPIIEAGNETPHPSPKLPTIEVGNVTPELSPKLPTIEVGNETPHTSAYTPSPDKPRNPFGEQDVDSSLDDRSHSTEIIPVPTESPRKEMTPIPKNPKKQSSGNIVHGNDLVMMMMVLKKLEVELQETKAELKLLKEKGTETEVALASLNAELHKSMSRIAKVEANEPGKAKAKSITSNDEGENKETETKNEEKTIRSELMVKSIDSPTLAQILSISDYEGYFKENKLKTKKLMKKKPIVPLVTDLFPWKKKKGSPKHVVSEPIFSKMYFT